MYKVLYIVFNLSFQIIVVGISPMIVFIFFLQLTYFNTIYFLILIKKFFNLQNIMSEIFLH